MVEVRNWSNVRLSTLKPFYSVLSHLGLDVDLHPMKSIEPKYRGMETNYDAGL